MREVVLELIEDFGPDQAFSEVEFFDTIVEMTYPEVKTFIDDYIKGTEILPIESYYSKLGIEYNELDFSFRKISDPTAEQVTLFEIWSKNL
ncbi:MAG: hypothetical protein ABJI85_08275, partial [Reichenbachiella sp.]